jgi:hypothetical protein
MASVRKTKVAVERKERLMKRSEKGRVAASKPDRVVLFPTEPSILGRKRIEEAVERVVSKRSMSKKQQ